MEIVLEVFFFGLFCCCFFFLRKVEGKDNVLTITSDREAGGQSKFMTVCVYVCACMLAHYYMDAFFSLGVKGVLFTSLSIYTQVLLLLPVRVSFVSF